LSAQGAPTEENPARGLVVLQDDVCDDVKRKLLFGELTKQALTLGVDRARKLGVLDQPFAALLFAAALPGPLRAITH
jgi:hypothetical protein